MFSITISPDLDKIFRHSKHFVENEKDGNHLVQGLRNMMDEVEQTNQNPVFFPVRFLLNVALHYHGEAQRFSH